MPSSFFGVFSLTGERIETKSPRDVTPSSLAKRGGVLIRIYRVEGRDIAVWADYKGRGVSFANAVTGEDISGPVYLNWMSEPETREALNAILRGEELPTPVWAPPASTPEQVVLEAARELMQMRLRSRRSDGSSVDPIEQKALVKYLEAQLINRALALPTDEPVSG